MMEKCRASNRIFSHSFKSLLNYRSISDNSTLRSSSGKDFFADFLFFIFKWFWSSSPSQFCVQALLWLLDSGFAHHFTGNGQRCIPFFPFHRPDLLTCANFYRNYKQTLWPSLERGLGGMMYSLQCRSFGSAGTKIQRNPSFATLNSDDITYFKGVLGEKNVVQDEDRLEFVNADWMHKYKGSSRLLLLPTTTDEVHFSPFSWIFGLYLGWCSLLFCLHKVCVLFYFWASTDGSDKYNFTLLIFLFSFFKKLLCYLCILQLFVENWYSEIIWGRFPEISVY